MALTILPSHAYALLGGLYVGKFTNFFSDIVITALVLYIVTPQIFTEDRLERAKNYFWSWFSPRQQITIEMSDLSTLKLTEEQKFQLKLWEKHAQSKQPPQLTGNMTSPLFAAMASLPKIEVVPSPKGNIAIINGQYVKQ